MGPGFFLSHHAPQELHRCYRWGPVHVCARCLGVYPVLFATLAVCIALRLPLWFEADLPVVLALTVPALADWSYGQFRPQAGSNPWRTFTGALLGVALGRSLYVHFHRPLPQVLTVQLGLVAVVVPLVILGVYWRRRAG